MVHKTTEWFATASGKEAAANHLEIVKKHSPHIFMYWIWKLGIRILSDIESGPRFYFLNRRQIRDPEKQTQPILSLSGCRCDE